MSAAELSWIETNQQRLSAAIEYLREVLERHIAQHDSQPATGNGRPRGAGSDDKAPPPPAPAMAMLAQLFDLSTFEQQTLLLCAAVELDSTFPALCARAHGDPAMDYATFSLALATLDEPHWSATAADAPLRKWRLIEIGAGGSLTLSPARIDERVLQYLTGVATVDQRIAALARPLDSKPSPVPSHVAVAERIARVWAQPETLEQWPVIQLCGPEISDKLAVARTVCSRLGLTLNHMYAEAIPVSLSDLSLFTRLWDREAALSRAVLFLECDEIDSSDAARWTLVKMAVERISTPLIISHPDRWRSRHRPIIPFDIGKPSPQEQRALWRDALAEKGIEADGLVDRLVSQFNLSLPAISAATATAQGDVLDDAELGRALWDAGRAQARPRLDDLAQRIEALATWDNLVLPEAVIALLREIAIHVRQRTRVYEHWGFASKSARGLGTSVLFAGASGTGKTMAAEVLANELQLDLYKIDLSSLVSKYIGETEKNLRKVFDAADDGGAILLFDEADALFGKRSEVKDSHDRYANIEVSYLLQRMEAYRGLAILTTNLRSALDHAFLRRLRFIVRFPFPDIAERAEIWRRIFPEQLPTEGLCVEKLAQLDLAGGSIRNIALLAAFLAAEEGTPVRMHHLLRAARTEYAKLEKPLAESEIAGWTSVVSSST